MAIPGPKRNSKAPARPSKAPPKAPSKAPPRASKSPPKRQIMVVDDDASIRDLIRKSLMGSYEVREAKDGLAAAEVLGQNPLPELLILDLMMPQVDGFTLAAMMKNDARLKRIPILFLSARDKPDDFKRAMTLGAKHYLTKPFSVKELRALVEKIVRVSA